MINFTREQWDALVRRLNDGGCPVLHDHGYRISSAGLTIEKIPGTSFNEIFSLEHGGTGYEIEFVLRNEARRPIDVQGLQIRTPWGVPKISLLPAPTKSSQWYPDYRFPEAMRCYDGSYVFNRFFARRKSRLNPGEELEGLLVASSEEAIPAAIPHLARIIATLVIFDSRRNAYSAQFRLPVIRQEVMAREMRDHVRQTGDHEDLKPTADPAPRPFFAPPAPTEPSEQELAEILERFCEDMTRASERHQGRIRLELRVPKLLQR
jgi:hypothetical protein